MVVAATLRAVLQGDCCCFAPSYKMISWNPFFQPKDKEQRQNGRRKEWNIWLASTADDIDLIADWWFWWSTYNGERGGFEDTLTFVLFIFCCLGTLTWLLELIQLTCIRPEITWAWLHLLILCVEDIPQMVITLMINDRFSSISSLALFNLITSFYSLLIRLAGELFLNACYCCVKVEDEEEQKVRRYNQLP